MKRIFVSLLASLAALTTAIILATPASAAANSCSAGTYWIDTSNGSLSNGTLYAGMCLASGTGYDIRHVNVGYQKTSGSGVSVRMGWELSTATPPSTAAAGGPEPSTCPPAKPERSHSPTAAGST